MIVRVFFKRNSAIVLGEQNLPGGSKKPVTKVWVLEYTSEQLRGVIEKKIQLDVSVWQNHIGLDYNKG